MPQVKKEHKRCRKQENQQHSFSASNAAAAESRIPSKKKRFMFVKLKGLGCKGTPVTAASTPAIIRSAADWESKGARNQTNQNKKKKRKQPLHSRRNVDNVVVDVPDVCCTPPGIGIASDVAPRARNHAPHRKHSREARRNNDDATQEFPAVLSVGIGSRTAHRSAEEIIEMLMTRQALLPGRILRRHDQYQDWRLDVDDMTYEELLNLGDRIGYVGTGLQEEDISNCVRKFNHDSAHAHGKDWECSICQEKCRVDDEIGILECGHHHHVECIKQWLLQKNACPVCKSAALRDKSK
ncbi:E3 ubiquitin-protein ligase MBR2-like [Salvia miltiorrhiza]|uniref:E3 ubiquitin-protein ligase MBR2-like n=1 Tax=Salvia miltiorrhiza TaxID=226208 RepID=UPI0025AD22B5|nr:E3 ubiquitin-protein ligase MBR2-like [Salvia miltiorrhiza]